MRKGYSRRSFLKSTLSAGVAIAGAQMAFSEEPGSREGAEKLKDQYDPKGLPTTVLGKTGVSDTKNCNRTG